MPNDALDIELCHTIRLCWKNAPGIKALKGFVFDADTLSFYKSMGMTEDDVVLGAGIWGCGDSASRLCKLLLNNELNTYQTAPDAVDVTDSKKLDKELLAMKMTIGCILARMNVLGQQSGSTHSYVFLGLNRITSKEPLDGHIYQTNVGCAEAFDLNAWIGDAKFQQVVNLEQHLKGLATEIFDHPVDSYQREYMLTGTTLNTGEVQQKTAYKVDGVRFMWRPVDLNVARANLKSLRSTSPVKVWPVIAPAKGAHLTV
jgi:hypothetical protein